MALKEIQVSILFSILLPSLFHFYLVNAFLQDQFELNGEFNVETMDDTVCLTLTKEGGSGFHSINSYSFGKFSMTMKLMEGYSAGVIATFFLVSGDYSNRTEFDFEFIGSSTSTGIKLQTNAFKGGMGDRESFYALGFDSAYDFHVYSFEWTPSQTNFIVDGNLIRTIWNDGAASTPVSVCASIWDGERYFTVPVNYTYEPFRVEYSSFTYESLEDN